MSKEYKLVSIGATQDSLGRPLEHGQIIAGANNLPEMSERELGNLNSLLGMVGVEIVDQETYDRDYKS